MIRIATVLALAAATMIPTGCANKAKRGQTFMSSLRTYNDGVRWQRFAKAAKHIPAAERDDFLDERADLDKELMIHNWEILRVSYKDRDRTRADVRIRYTWHLDSKGLVKETTTLQRWELHGPRWLLAEEARDHGETMPGIAEPPEEGELPEKEPVSAR